MAVESRDVHRLMRLLIDVTALKMDAVIQRQHLADGFQQLFKAKIGWVAVIDNWRPDRRVAIQHQIISSSSTPQWLKYLSDFSVNNPIHEDVFADHSLRSNDLLQVWGRYQVLPNAAARKKYAACVAMIDLLELGDGIVAGYRTGPKGDRFVGISMHRDRKTPRFTPNEFALARLAVEEMQEMEKRGHLEFRQLGDTELPPRLAQVLDRILNGKSAKEVASDLHLSVHTVREHLKRLYQRYNVSNREELTAKFLR